MTVEIRPSLDVKEPYVIIHAGTLTPEIEELAKRLENEKSTANVLAAKRENRIYILEPNEIQIVRTEGNEIVAYDTAKKRFIVDKRLYEIEALLGHQFIRISKSAIVNIHKIDHVDVRFSGMTDVVMKNGVNENISRRHMGDFKKRLGL
ncbi:MAG: LytTR family transcriptional regulator [Treponema sp.]|nr:LytTR family transcriptional regulator [Treponema sp.]